MAFGGVATVSDLSSKVAYTLSTPSFVWKSFSLAPSDDQTSRSVQIQAQQTTVLELPYSAKELPKRSVEISVSALPTEDSLTVTLASGELVVTEEFTSSGLQTSEVWQNGSLWTV
jgi:hypothetical protein